MTDEGRIEAFRARAARIREEMGGAQRVARQHARGELTVRERIDRLVDPGSFREIGTFARSERPEDKDDTPGDGKIGGWAKIDGRPICVVGDDVTVKRGSSSVVGSRRMKRIIEHGIKHGHPIVYFGETGGARLPDTLGSEGFVKVPPGLTLARRSRRVPMATAIVGRSFGGSSFYSAHSDFVVQVEGSCLAVTSPRVIEIATGMKIDFEALGGVKVHEKTTGMIDRSAADEDEAVALIREFLSFLPDNAWSAPPRKPFDEAVRPDPTLYELVPERRQRGYDMRRVVRQLADAGHTFELKPRYAKELTVALGRIGGRSVGFMANNPMFTGGALTPEACDKGTAFLALCDAFNLPVVFLQDTPGFMVGRRVEHNRLLSRAIMFLQALSLCRVPRISIVLRKAFGLAFFSMSGPQTGAEFMAAWPNAEISFMDPQVGVNVVYAEDLANAADPEAERERLIEAWTLDTDPFGGAGIMEIDEIIDPADTRGWLVDLIERVDVEIPPRGTVKPLAYWPTCY